MYQVQQYDAQGRDITFNNRELAAPEDSDPLTLLLNAEEELTCRNNGKPPSFSALCKYLNL